MFLSLVGQLLSPCGRAPIKARRVPAARPLRRLPAYIYTIGPHLRDSRAASPTSLAGNSVYAGTNLEMRPNCGIRPPHRSSQRGLRPDFVDAGSRRMGLPARVGLLGSQRSGPSPASCAPLACPSRRFYYSRAFNCCLEARALLGCSPSYLEPCLEYSGDCGDLPAQFRDIPGAGLPEEYECHQCDPVPRPPSSPARARARSTCTHARERHCHPAPAGRPPRALPSMPAAPRRLRPGDPAAARLRAPPGSRTRRARGTVSLLHSSASPSACRSCSSCPSCLTRATSPTSRNARHAIRP